MKGIIIDPSRRDAEDLRSLCAGIGQPEIAGIFQFSSDALEFLHQHGTDVVFCAWDMPDMERGMLSRMIRSAAPNAALIYIAQAEVPASAAFEADASGCFVKPVDRKGLLVCIERLRCVSAGQPPIRVRTFGHFDLYVNGSAVVFRNGRAKEMLALLIDSQGGTVTMDRFIEAFWPDEPYSEQHKAIYRKAALALKNTLASYGIGRILLTSRNQKAVVPAALDCDYYRFLAGDREAAAEYHGEYMTDYSWAEETNSRLWRLAQRRGYLL